MIAATPNPPYYAVIFSSVRTEFEEGYAETAEEMVRLAEEQEGYLGYESVRDGLGITVSYWASLDAIRNWKQQTDHQVAQKLGRANWYAAYKTRICKVERDYEFFESEK
ncbi:heme-degrading monooxygenase HmoA [Algoriphagus ratkowskyi]|uniref:Antibiotic biosynthesis monooxygenase n=1 Tax=Algoriphagus ratkowskyi TaxID=57028 RepID=A0A2W7R9E0_9BACT|nr:antibiotic biosynthesis monooxygenase [Algoriphagus ratkowskyi]PZX57064.1 heme-degrading monooxygenase HmoA [Algoriphagus ratkowskyi]TXD79960.1 antibiotic biosynthesis monooxygenase [Algoriphagus ratkowskyi]